MIKDTRKHLALAKETYLNHFKEATKIGSLMIIGGIQAFLHGLCPGILKKSASSKIKELYNVVSKRSQ